jgi:predicted aspartyl protease
LNFLREKICEIQKPKTKITTKNEMYKTSSEGSNVVSTDKPETDQIIYFIHDEKQSRCPEVEMKLTNGTVLRSIVDSGSEVNIISQQVFDQLRKDQKGIPVLPVENVKLVTAFGKRSRRINTQALIEFVLGEDEFENFFIISPQLTHDVIIGCQLLKEYGMNINFENGTIGYVRHNTKKQVKFMQEPSDGHNTNDELIESQRTASTLNVKEESEWNKDKCYNHYPIMISRKKKRYIRKKDQLTSPNP